LLWGGRVDRPGDFPLRADLNPEQRVTAHVSETNMPEALEMYAELTGRRWLRATNTAIANVGLVAKDRMAAWGWIRRVPKSGTIQYHADGAKTALEVKQELEMLFKRKEVIVIAQGEKAFKISSSSN
jgi:hypothetical protein